MPRIAVVGVGQMGRSALSILAESDPMATFVACDRLQESVDAAVAVDPTRITGWVGDVLDDTLPLDGVDVVLNLAGPFFVGSDAVARAAITQGISYVDVGDDVECTDAILALHKKAERAGVTLVTGAGLSPGVSNWMAARLLDEHPDADGVEVAWVVHETDPGGLAPLRHMLHMAVSPCPVLRDGRWESSPGFVPATAGRYQFPEPLGEVEAYDTAHPEPRTLARHYPHLRYASCKGALLPQWANQAFSTLGQIGFGYTDVKVDVGGVQVEPAEFLWRLMWERYSRRPARERHATTAVLVQVLRGADVLGALAISDDEVMARGTGLGAACAVTTLLESGAPAGAFGPEVLPHDRALALFEKLAFREGGYRQGVIAMKPATAA
ncbi:saccharopine dehydrogenase family protein [Pedococcus sp. NPDC057267]|uniref:saccharopine dehydrogenase family protein n=1 Tax=Pedococcus sp. NPDC057267 TaxID=3346077 RepID=UPI00363EF7C9